MTRRTALFFSTIGAALCRNWEEDEFPNWSQSLIDRLVTDSPWSRPWRGTAEIIMAQKLGSSFSQIGGIGLPSPIPGVGWPGGTRGRSAPTSTGPSVLRVGVDLIVRWASALPVRRALALQEFGREGLNKDRAAALLNPDASETRIQLAGIPRVAVGEDIEALKRQLRLAVRVVVPGRRPLMQPEVEVPSYGAQLTATLVFPSIEVSSAEGEIAFSAAFSGLRIEKAFKLRSMIYHGQIEL